MPEGEFAFIDWIRHRTPLDATRFPVPIGDDMAVIAIGGERVLFATDMLLAGTHFDLAKMTPKQIGRKALAVNLSDVAAMAAKPVCAVAAVGLAPGFSRTDCEQLYIGMQEIGDAFDCPLAGGDVTTGRGPMSIAISILAEPAGIEPVTRSGSKVGDAIAVTGALGGSIAGGHFSFTPRIVEARRLAKECDLSAMIDLSDGLSSDLRHICNESGVGAEIDAAAVPIADAAEGELSRALCDGEDFELLFTLPAGQADRLDGLGLDCGVTVIGRVVESGMHLLTATGREPLEPHGYEHRIG